MADLKIRQSQALNTYGIGAMIDFPGLSVMVLSPDYLVGNNTPANKKDLTSWGIDYRKSNRVDKINRIFDVRLAKLLGVESFVIPPLETEKTLNWAAFPSINTIRFPGALFCPNCKSIHFVSQLELHDNQRTVNNQSFTCNNTGCSNSVLAPTRFVIATSFGHIDDFPWDWFVHKHLSKRGNRGQCAIATNHQHLQLIYGASASISDMKVKCTNCNAEESLGSIFSQEQTFMNTDDPYLYDRNAPGEDDRRNNILALPWKGKLGTPKEYFKDRALYRNITPRVSMFRGLLNIPDQREKLKKYYPLTLQRGAGNVYFSVNHRGISLPPSFIIQNMQDNTLQIEVDHIINLVLDSVDFNDDITGKNNEEIIRQNIIPFLQNNQMVINYYGSIIVGKYIEKLNAFLANNEVQNIESISLKTRIEEYECFCSHNNDNGDPSDWYKSEIIEGSNLNRLSNIFDKIVLLHKVKQLNIQIGFTRVRPLAIDELKFSTQNLNEAFKEEKSRIQDVRKNPELTKWLPAGEVKGEGILLQFNNDKLQAWLDEYGEWISKRMKILHSNYTSSLQKFGTINDVMEAPPVNARYVLLHTLSHILIDALAQDSGYNSTSLSEIIYCDQDNGDYKMNGILIYTSTSDAEGTLGGLVNMGRPQKLEELLIIALNKAQWCSSDPICIETESGQGFMGLNLSACHACCLLPETSCENMNKFLDRALLIGNLGNPEKGFFKNLGYI